MKISIWLVTRERGTWITAGEILALAVVLLVPSGPLIRLLFGVPLLVHLGYRALTGLPMGSIPGRPPRGQARRHYDLRARVVRFLDEVKRAEDFAQRAEVARLPDKEVQEHIFKAQRRVMVAAREVAKQTGRQVARA